MKKILIFAVVAGIILAVYYLIFSKEEWNEEGPQSPVAVSDEQKYVENLNESEIQKVVFHTLPEHALKSEYGGRVFCSNYIFGYEGDYKGNVLNVYLHAYCEEYYLKGDKITLGSGVSYPLKLIYRIEKQSLLYDSLVLPKDGSEYGKSIADMFPAKYVDEAVRGVDIKALIPSPKTQAENYYKGKLEVYF